MLASQCYKSSLLVIVQAETTDVNRLAQHLSLLLEGALSRAGLDGDDTRVQHARQIAASLLAAL